MERSSEITYPKVTEISSSESIFTFDDSNFQSSFLWKLDYFKLNSRVYVYSFVAK